MAHLSLSLLGTFQVTLDGEPVTAFESGKVQALLAYLTVESGQSHRRETLTGLLWPERPERNARQNLSQALFNLRQAIGDHDMMPPFLIITPQTLQFNQASDYSLDIASFTELMTACKKHRHDRLAVCETCLERLQRAATLYHGSFLEGFSLKDSPVFEEWVLLEREHFQRHFMEVLDHLADCYEQRGQYEAAQQQIRRRVELEPWQEESHQQLMRLLAVSGQRSAALAQYNICCQTLAAELGVEPTEETTALYELIRDKRLGRRDSAVVPVVPPLALSVAPASPAPLATFVARERELAQLADFLDLALTGQGRVAFITGEAGSGKTLLFQEFARRAQKRHADLIVAGGNCNAYSGHGDPYLPFREILGLLTGDVEAGWIAGNISRERANRLWALLPHTAQNLANVGPDLIDTFIPGPPLAQRAALAFPDDADWLVKLNKIVARQETHQGRTKLKQSDLFEQYTRVLQELAQQQPLLLTLDDLQWADTGSISLLFHLGRRMQGYRILVVGAYRPTEVALDDLSATVAQGKQHPLISVVNEFQRHFGQIGVDLEQAQHRQFVNAFIDTEPNRLGTTFREALYRHTEGHALFTVEMLHGMQERGDLIQDEAGRWIEGTAVDWQSLPARVEGVIKERLGQLPVTLQETLKVASVEGETFTSEVTARVQALKEPKMIHQLSSTLDKQYRVVRVHSSQRLGTQPLSRYRFRHILFQKYLYDSLDDVERVHLHEAVGHALEQLYDHRVEEIAVRLARHFQIAGLTMKAIECLQQAGDRAMRLFAYEEAAMHFTRGLVLIESLPNTPERVQQELTLQIALASALTPINFAAPEVKKAYDRALVLSRQVEDNPQLFSALWGLHEVYTVRGEGQKARELGEQCLRIAQSTQDPDLLLQANHAMWSISFHFDRPALALEYAEQGIALYDPQRHHAHAFLYGGHNPGICCRLIAARSLWLLGYPDQALSRIREAVTLGQELSHHPFSLAQALSGVTQIHQFRRETQSVRKQAEATLAAATKHGLLYFMALGTIQQGWALATQGQVEEGIAQIRQGIATRPPGLLFGVSYDLALLVEASLKARRIEEGLAALAEALANVTKTNERFWEAELYRLQGEMLLVDDDKEPGAFPSSRQDREPLSRRDKVVGLSPEICFLKAIEVAHDQQAKSLELRATVSLSRLWQDQGKPDQARQMLAEIYDWFTEGLDTPDLKQARALLQELTFDDESHTVEMC